MMCDGCQYPMDGNGHAAGCLRDAVDRLSAQVADLRRKLFDALKRGDAWEQDCAHWRERAEEAETKADRAFFIEEGRRRMRQLEEDLEKSGALQHKSKADP